MLRWVGEGCVDPCKGKGILKRERHDLAATFDENRRAVGMLKNPMHDKNEGTCIPRGRKVR